MEPWDTFLDVVLPFQAFSEARYSGMGCCPVHMTAQCTDEYPFICPDAPSAEAHYTSSSILSTKAKINSLLPLILNSSRFHYNTTPATSNDYENPKYLLTARQCGPCMFLSCSCGGQDCRWSDPDPGCAAFNDVR